MAITTDRRECSPQSPSRWPSLSQERISSMAPTVRRTVERVTPQPSVRRAMTTGWRIMGEPLAIQPVPMEPTNIIRAPKNPCQMAM
jgi:hypothetical protein